VLAFGINDCALHDEEQLPPLVAKLSDAARTLVDAAGARSFLLLDVPPLERSPGCERLGPLARSAGPRYAAWNALLLAAAPTLAPGADVLLFSAARVVRDMLDDHRACGLWAREEAWVDRIHLSGRGHEVLAGRVLDALFME
jgi:lysophospholipase L1-like esterase